MRCLVTGFEPIFGIKRTPSGELAKLWSSGSLSVPDVDVKSIILPQLFGVAAQRTCTEILSYRPHLVIMFGATQHNDPIRLERFAINIKNTTMGDNSRIPIRSAKISTDGPSAYEASWSCRDIVDALGPLGINAIESFHAGTHVCNDQLYLVMKWLSENDIGHPVGAGFVHVSFPDEFGVVEDRNWHTSGFSGIVDASIKIINAASEWYARVYQHNTR